MSLEFLRAHLAAATAAIALLASACGPPNVDDPQAVLPLDSLDSERGVEELRRMLEGRTLVQLGEELHITREMPRAKADLVELLHDELGFRLLLFEGSTVDAWIASDFLLQEESSSAETAERARDLGLPVIWHSAPYTELLSYVRDSYRGPEPLYLASYDFQPGFSRLRAESLPTLMERLEAYAPPPDGAPAHRDLLRLFSDRRRGFPNRPLPDRDALHAAIDWLESWIESAAGPVRTEHGVPMHARTLRMIPGQLRHQIEVWEAFREPGEMPAMRALQETRDELAAPVIERFRTEVAPNGKALVWAHHVHVYHNTLGETPHALGSDLLESAGDDLYTIGVFAGSGEHWAVKGEQVSARTFDVTDEDGVEAVLDDLTDEDAFVDFASVRDPEARRALSSETRTARGFPTVPARDFHGAVYLHRVTKPEIRRFWEEDARP